MVKIFNAIQIVSMFAGLPFILNWLTTSGLQFASAAVGVGCVLYAILFFFLVYSVFVAIEK